MITEHQVTITFTNTKLDPSRTVTQKHSLTESLFPSALAILVEH
jgi:hypothetical protein